uniref:Uncharacterized protein n=1 Tax=Accipiter nisus TaxID=211598 RepID=A0A8B9N632_9AVES
ERKPTDLSTKHPAIRDTSEEGKETHLCQATALRNCLPLPGISILDKLIKTCPVWLQLNMNQERAGAILGKETAGVSPNASGDKSCLCSSCSHHPQTQSSAAARSRQEKS